MIPSAIYFYEAPLREWPCIWSPQLKAMGELEEAKPLMEEALQAQRETLGNDHPHTLTSINNLALLLKERKEDFISNFE